MNALVPNRTWATGVPRLSDDVKADLIAHYENVSRRLSQAPRLMIPPRIVWEMPVKKSDHAPIEQLTPSCDADLIDAFIKRQIFGIIVTVSKFYGVSTVDLISRRRSPDLVLPRHVAMFLAKKLTTKSLPEIGLRFDGRDHTSILFAVRKIERLIAASPEFAEEVDKLRAACLCKEGDGA